MKYSMRKHKRHWPLRRSYLFVLAIAVIGVLTLLRIMAASNNVSIDPVSATAPATVVNDSLASGGKAVQFGPAATTNGFVQVCGLQLCLNGAPFVIHGATGYGTYGDPASEVALAKQGKVNVLELVEFDDNYHDINDVMSSGTWTKVDKFIAAFKNAGLHVILNLSEYYQSLQASGQTPTTTDWNTYLSFIANRTNTVTGVKYKDEPTIAMVELIGEADAPAYGHPHSGTTQQMTDFFKRTMAQWRVLAPKILVTTGGFSYLNDSGSGIDWRSIMSDPGSPMCNIEVNSTDDRDITVPMVTDYCKNLGKPWFLAAWSSCYQPTSQTYPFLTRNDDEMAAHATEMYNIAKGTIKSKYPAVGADFWNLQNEGNPPNGSCALNPTYFPKTFAVIQSTAP